MRILLLGAGGLLGGAFARALEGRDVVTAGRDALDVRAHAAIAALVRDAAAGVVINCAADTAVDRAEDDPEEALRANAMLPTLLAQQCRRSGAVLVHVSSTGCYGAWKATPYDEDDPLRPTTAHHRSKLAGEAGVREAGCESLILRAGWLFGGAPTQPRNFVWNRLVEAHGQARLVSDPFQRGNPTRADEFAAQALDLIEAGLRGTFNCVSGPGVSRLDYVARIVAASGLPCRVEAAPEPFARRAPVSANETAVNGRLGLLGMDRMPPWTEAVDRFVAELMATPAWAERAGARP